MNPHVPYVGDLSTQNQCGDLRSVTTVDTQCKRQIGMNKVWLPRLPPRYATWLCEGENTFNSSFEQLIYFALLVKEASK
jgi:hypothetical protein